jgi:hypothetical protein
MNSRTIWRAVTPAVVLVASCNAPDAAAEHNPMDPNPIETKASITIRTVAGSLTKPHTSLNRSATSRQVIWRMLYGTPGFGAKP